MDRNIDFSPSVDATTTMPPSDGDSPELSVVIPTYGAEACLPVLYRRLTTVLSGMRCPYELVFIDDGSPDGSWPILLELARKDKHVQAYKLSRNFGQQMAITAGFEKARGRWLVVMDCDLQDPPEYIPLLYARAKQGKDIVFAKRKQRQLSPMRRMCNKLYFRILNFFSQSNITGEYGAFSIVSRPVRDAYLRFSDRNRHYLMILFWLGFEVSDIEYDQATRYAGESSYSLGSLVRLAAQGLFFQTTNLLKMIVTLGFCISFAGVLLAAWAVISLFMHGALPGWTSITVLILLSSGAVLTCQGIVGLYIGQIFDQVKARPLYVINERLSDEWKKYQSQQDVPSISVARDIDGQIHLRSERDGNHLEAMADVVVHE